MKIKGFVLIALTIVFFSCKRELNTSYHQHASSPTASAAVEDGHDGFSVALLPESNTVSTPLENNRSNTIKQKSFLGKGKAFVTNTIAKKYRFGKETKKDTTDKKGIKKETDPRLSRGLWMTIFGGIATTLGIVFMGYAPTGLFVFAFGIVFVVGVVTLIMYLANPKPKM